LATEKVNQDFAHIDELNPAEFARLMSQEDGRIAAIVAGASNALGNLVGAIVPRMRQGGRILYFGAGTSGRLGVLDAAECHPTFHCPHGQIQGMIAGGMGAMFRAVEGAEDSQELGALDLAKLDADSRDTVVGIAASGRTPYVIGVLKEAKKRGCLTAAVVAVRHSELSHHAEHVVEVESGPEVLAGSTRLKAGTATKMALNILTTATMVAMGKTHGNLMVDMMATNEKLKKRAIRLVSKGCGLDLDLARSLLESCGGEVKTAMVSHLAGIDPSEARRRLVEQGGIIKKALAHPGRSEGLASPTPVRRTIVVGIDGGGSGLKMRFRQVDTNLDSGVLNGPAVLPVTHGWEGTVFEWHRRILGWLIAQNLNSEAIGAIVVGTSGAGTEAMRDLLRQGLTRHFPGARVEVHSDASIIGVAGGDPAGLILIAGTGSIAWWEPRPGLVVRAGGWGPGADEGSGAWLVEEAVKEITRAEDGRGPKTSLRDSFLQGAGVCDVRSLVAWRRETPRSEMARLAQAVMARANEGDPVAMALRQKALDELTALVRATLAQGPEGVRPTQAFAAGGLFRDEAFWDGFRDRVGAGAAANPRWTRVTDPVDGALNLAIHALSTS